VIGAVAVVVEEEWKVVVVVVQGGLRVGHRTHTALTLCR
jgi:hypothetical protein